MQKPCPECGGATIVESDAPCSICGGKGFLIKDKKPVTCTGGCSWGAVKVSETCPTCRGKGYVEVKA